MSQIHEQQTHPGLTVKIFAEEGAVLPEYETQLASGCDLRAFCDQAIELKPLQRELIPTGLRLEIPAGYEGQVRPRSGQAYKKGLSMPNSPGTIDADYRGELKVLVINLNTESIIIQPGERIAQLVFAPVVQAGFARISVESDLQSSHRQEGGFGSTGI